MQVTGGCRRAGRACGQTPGELAQRLDDRAAHTRNPSWANASPALSDGYHRTCFGWSPPRPAGWSATAPVYTPDAGAVDRCRPTTWPSPARSGSATTPPSTRNTADATASRALAVGCRRTARHAGLASFSGRSVLTKRRCPVSQDRQVTPSGAPPRQASRRTLLARLLRDNPHGRKSCSIAAQWKRTYPPPTINRARQLYAEKLGMKPVAEFGGEALRYKTSSGPSSTSTRPSTPGRPVTPSPNGTSTTSTRRSGI